MLTASCALPVLVKPVCGNSRALEVLGVRLVNRPNALLASSALWNVLSVRLMDVLTVLLDTIAPQELLTSWLILVPKEPIVRKERPWLLVLRTQTMRPCTEDLWLTVKDVELG